MYRTYSNQQQYYLLWQVRIAGRKFIIVYDNDKGVWYSDFKWFQFITGNYQILKKIHFHHSLLTWPSPLAWLHFQKYHYLLYYRKSSINPPPGGGGLIYFKSIWGRLTRDERLIWEAGGGAYLIQKKIIASALHKELEYKVKNLKYKTVGRSWGSESNPNF